MREVVLTEQNNVDEKDFELYNIVDTPEEAVKVIDEFYAKYLLSPNF